MRPYIAPEVKWILTTLLLQGGQVFVHDDDEPFCDFEDLRAAQKLRYITVRDPSHGFGKEIRLTDLGRSVLRGEAIPARTPNKVQTLIAAMLRPIRQWRGAPSPAKPDKRLSQDR